MGSQRSIFVVTVVPLAATGRPITKCSMSLTKSGFVRDLVQVVAAEAKITNADRCVLAELFEGEIFKFFDDTDQLSNIRSRDVLLLYELDDNSAGKVIDQQ